MTETNLPATLSDGWLIFCDLLFIICVSSLCFFKSVVHRSFFFIDGHAKKPKYNTSVFSLCRRGESENVTNSVVEPKPIFDFLAFSLGEDRPQCVKN